MKTLLFLLLIAANLLANAQDYERVLYEIFERKEKNNKE